MATTSTTPAAATDTRKRILISFTAEQVARIEAHQARLSASLGGTRMHFQTAVLQLIGLGLDEVERPADVQ